MQKGSCNDDVIRSRFHASALTAAYTPKGTDFSDIPQVTILYITEYDALHNNQAVTHVKRCMQTAEGFLPVEDKEDIFFANTEVKENSDKSELLQLLLRKDSFHNGKYPKLSEAIRYYKETEGGQEELCKLVEDYAYDRELKGREEGREEGREKERLETIRRMIEKDYSKEEILDLGYSEEEYKKAEQTLLVDA